MDDAASSGINFHNEADRPGRITITGNVGRRSASHGIQARTGGRGATYPAESMIITSNRVEDSGGNGIQAGWWLTAAGWAAYALAVIVVFPGSVISWGSSLMLTMVGLTRIVTLTLIERDAVRLRDQVHTGQVEVVSHE